MNYISEPITSRDNPAVKHFRKLMTSKKERRSCREFALEGSRLVFDALKNNAPVTKLLITVSAAAKYENLLSEYSDIEKIFISDELGEKISDTGTTQGIFAQCDFIDCDNIRFSLKLYGRYVVLSGLQDPGNAGMIIRTADAMGLDGVILSNSCDIYNPKVVRATMGSLFRIPVFSDVSEDEIFMALDSAQIPSFAAVVDRNATDLNNADFSRGGAIFIGNEGNGLSDGVVLKCKESITIKMHGNIESLNAAMATGIIMWELMK